MLRTILLNSYFESMQRFLVIWKQWTGYVCRCVRVLIGRDLLKGSWSTCCYHSLH